MSEEEMLKNGITYENLMMAHGQDIKQGESSDTFSESMADFAAQILKMEQITSKLQITQKQRKPQNVP